LFVNNTSVYKDSRVLYNGDVIYIMGLKIIIMKNSIYVNNPQENVTFNNNYFAISKVKNDFPEINNIQINDDEEIELYNESDYYSRAPRITKIIEKERVKIDNPPQVQDNQDTPLFLLLGSSLSMGVVTIVSLISRTQRTGEKASVFDTLLPIISSSVMLISMLLIPLLNVRYTKNQKIKYEDKRQKRYKEYLNSKSDQIRKITKKQKDILFENYSSADECIKIILENSPRLWERKIEDHDFLSIRLGIGDVPLQIDYQYPEESFTMVDDNLVEILNNIAESTKLIKNAPIVTSLTEKNVTAFISREDELLQRFMQNIIIQLVAFQSYRDLKLVFLLKKDDQRKWDFVKMLPHVWDDSKQLRFFADDYDEMKELSMYLEEVLKSRTGGNAERTPYSPPMGMGNNQSYKSFAPYYLIITDDYKQIEDLRIITEMLKLKTNVGFGLLCLTDDLIQLPNECKTFVSIEQGQGMLFDSELSSTSQTEIALEPLNTFFFDKITQKLANIPMRYKEIGSNALPSNYAFLEMYDVGRIEQLNILNRWKKNDSTLSLKAPVGIDASGMKIALDIHEKFHGPHGLIAGSTGSGKSEFIITYILSMAINYHPNDVTFLLIDYKGGGLSGAFEKGKIKLPHLVGKITNIEKSGLQRSLDSIGSELRRRQILFNEARNMTDEGTIDIYKYQRLYHDGVVKEPIPHLLIISDEFAELKQQQPEFMDELISISRIGRSLGVHLILATQKPSGIVNEQIRSNSKFAICLKVQNRSDSMDVIGQPDAASLRNAGQFYMKVGNNEYFTLGQSAWSGATYFPADVVKKKVDNSIEFISNIGVTIKKADNTVQQIMNDEGEQLTNIVKYIGNLAQQEGIKTKSLWLDTIPEDIFVEDLRKKYKVKVDNNKIEIVFGEYDDPANQKQGIVKTNFSNRENMVIYGNSDSGKETLLSTMIFDMITTYTPEQIQAYVLDFGSEALKIFKPSPHVGDVIFLGEEEKLERFFGMIQQEIRDRKSILSDYNGDYSLYLNTSGKTMPLIIIMINSYETFAENYANKYDDLMITLTREGAKCGIVFVFTVSSASDVRYRLLQNFKKKVALQLNRDDDYLNVFEKVGKKRPAKMFGRGLIRINDKDLFEFQTAKVCDGASYNAYIQDTIKGLNEKYNLRAGTIRTLPDVLYIDDVKKNIATINKLPIGMAKRNLRIYNYDFTKRMVNVVSSKNINDAIDYITYIIEEMKLLKDINLVVLDAERSKKNDLKADYEKFAEAVNSNTNDLQTICIIIGIDKLFDNAEINESDFEQIVKKAESNENCNFIIVENATKYKAHQYEGWYKNNVTGENGIWVANGIQDQFLISTNADRRTMINNCGRSYGYVIEEGYLDMIKLIGMREHGEEE